MSVNWPFSDPEDLAVFTLKRIVGGESSILRVYHDEGDGGWQFLDGGEVAVEGASLVSLREMTRLDPGVLELADLPLGWVAERAGPGEPWQRTPPVIEEDRDSDIEECGWQVVLVPEDDEGPPFAYSIGLFQSFGHPEVIVFGLDLGVMHRVINLIGEGVKSGRRFVDGETAADVLEGYNVRFVEVGRRHFAEYLGHGSRFYEDREFPVLQCLWPDRQGRFPTDPASPDLLRERQPLLAR